MLQRLLPRSPTSAVITRSGDATSAFAHVCMLRAAFFVSAHSIDSALERRSTAQHRQRRSEGAANLSINQASRDVSRCIVYTWVLLTVHISEHVACVHVDGCCAIPGGVDVEHADRYPRGVGRGLALRWTCDQ